MSMPIPEEKTLELATESRQTHLKIFIRGVAIVDMVHVIFPICFFGNLAVAAAFTWVGPANDQRQRSLIYFAPVGVVAIVILSYGIVIAIRLFNSTDPDVRPSKSAKMAMCWWYYTIFLLVFEISASGYYFFMSYAQKDILGYMFSLMLNFSVAIKSISLYLVRKFITDMRNIEVRVAPEESRTILWRTPLVLQKQQQMRLLTKVVVIADLIQNFFMVLSLVYACTNSALEIQKLSSNDLGYGIASLVYILVKVVVFYYTLHIAFKLFKAADKIVDIQHLHEMLPAIQLKYNKIFRNWLIASIGCIIFVETDCLSLAIFRGNLIAVYYIGGLSLSFGIRAVCIYFIRRFRKDFWKKRVEGASDMTIGSTDLSSQGPRTGKKSIVCFREAPKSSELESPQISQPSETSESVSVSSQKTEPVTGILHKAAQKLQPLTESDTSQSSSEPAPKPAPAPPVPQASIPSPQPQPPEPASKELAMSHPPTASEYFRSLVEQKDSQSSFFLWKSTDN